MCIQECFVVVTRMNQSCVSFYAVMSNSEIKSVYIQECFVVVTRMNQSCVSFYAVMSNSEIKIHDLVNSSTHGVGIRGISKKREDCVTACHANEVSQGNPRNMT